MNGAIESYLILINGKSQKGVEMVINNVLENPYIYVFGEFLSLPNVQALGPNNKFFKTLNLFAFENYMTYTKSVSSYLPLTEK